MKTRDDALLRDAVGEVSISTAAEMLRTTPARLRRLEGEGILLPKRTAGGQRRYNRADIERIAGSLLANGDLLEHAVDLLVAIRKGNTGLAKELQGRISTLLDDAT